MTIDSHDDFFALMKTSPEAERKLELLRALGPVRFPDVRHLLPKNPSEAQISEIQEALERHVRRDRLRRLRQLEIAEDLET